MSKGKLTAAFVKANHIYFEPASRREAEFVLRSLFKLGVVWNSDGSKRIKDIDECLNGGMNVDHGGKIYLGKDTNKPFIKASAMDFPGVKPKDFWPIEERIDHLEGKVDALSKKLDRILEILEPSILQKPSPVRKAATSRKRGES